MKLFDQIDPGSLERRAWQLWILALTTIFVLATGLAVMMYMVIFSRPGEQSGRSVTTLFSGYCVLVPLLIGYLLDRQVVIKHLRRKVTEGETQIVNLQHEGSSNFLDVLPGLPHFQDRLAMEHRRATIAEQPFSLVMVGLKVMSALGRPAKGTITFTFGEVAKTLFLKLRGEDSIYHFGRGVFGILLPRVPTSIAHRVAERLRASLREAVGADKGFEFEIQVTNFPDDTVSARDMERIVMNFLGAHGEVHSEVQALEVSNGCVLKMPASR